MKEPLPPSVNLSLDLSAFLNHCHHILGAPSQQTSKGGTVLKEHSPVAWLLTSPALGVMLDWQVEENVLKYVQGVSGHNSFDEQQVSETSNTDYSSTHWFNILVVVDKYRCVEKDIPLIEVYQLCANGKVNLVNFDLN